MNKVPVVQEFMVTTLHTLRKEMDIFEAIDFLLKNKISGASVIDEKNQLIGMLSEKDCLRIFANGAFHQGVTGLVSDYMSKKVMTVKPDDDIFKAADIFLKNQFRRLPVINNGMLVGQISRRDILMASRKIWEASPVKKEWTDSKYLTPEIKAALADKTTSP